MSIRVIFLYFVAATILFFILNYIDKKENKNYVNHILVTLIYLILLAGFFTWGDIVKNNTFIFLIGIFEFLIRIFYVNYIEEKSFIRNYQYLLKVYIISLSSCYLVNMIFINQVSSVLPSSSDMKIIVWILILIYIYFLMKDYILIVRDKKEIISFICDKEYIVMSYAKLKMRFRELVQSKYLELNLTTYAVMIYHNYYKSDKMRKFDRLKYRLDLESRKLGIMQIMSNEAISDEESIRIFMKKLEKNYEKMMKKKEKQEALTILETMNYDKNMIEDIRCIYEVLINFEEKK